MTAIVFAIVALGIALVASWQVWLVAQQTAVLTARVDRLEKDLGLKP